MMNLETINKIFQIWKNENQNPQTELQYCNNYTLLVAVVLSAQTTDINVNKATKNLFTKIKSPKDMIKLGEEKLKNHIKTIGLYHTKAKNIINLSKILIEKFDSKIPNNFEDLISLPGVGRKTANVVLNCAFGYSTIAVDTHVFRVANRIGFVDEKTPDKTEISLIKIIPKKWIKSAHHWMILHGRYVCKAKKPICNSCKISQFCNKYQETKG